MNTQYKGYVITTQSDSHCAIIYKDKKIFKCIAGDIDKNGKHNAIEKSIKFINNN